jgi:hypothetical protein
MVIKPDVDCLKSFAGLKSGGVVSGMICQQSLDLRLNKKLAYLKKWEIT